MREKLLLNKEWHYHEVTKAEEPAKHSIAGMYISAKTERLKWGPGAYQHNDSPNPWSFEREIPAEKWELVDLPHDYIIAQTPTESEGAPRGFFRYHKAWYRRHLIIPDTDMGKRITLYFEGVTGICEVYFNGCFMKRNSSGYTPFEIDVTDYVRYDDGKDENDVVENVISVLVDPEAFDSWWYAGGGIYRNVWLIKTAPVAVDLFGVFAPAVLDGDAWRVDIETTLKSVDYEPRSVRIEHELIAPDGSIAACVGGDITVAPRAKAQHCMAVCVKAPVLWDVAAPALYTVKTSVYEGDTQTDCVSTRMGFRTVELSPTKGVLLNGKRIKLKGVCDHMDFGLFGKAVPDNICRHKIALIRSMGANALRTAHYPHNEATMNACDDLGLLVFNETRRFESCDESMEALEILVKRDRNHPSVFIWCTGNEEMGYHCMPQGANIQRAMAHLIKQLDPTRPVTTAFAYPEQCKIYDVVDVIAANYRLKELEGIHKKHPDKPLISSETCAVGSTRGQFYGDDPAHGYLDARDRDRDLETWYFGREGTWKYIMAHDWDCGGFQWNAFDYRGEANWPRVSSAQGAFDLFGQRKDSFYQNLSHWSDIPMIHVLPHWNHTGLEGKTINVWCYTNCEECELVLNGKSLGKQTAEKYTHLEWNVPFCAGKLEAIGYNSGMAVATEVHETTGAPVALRLRCETEHLEANGQDVALFTCYAVDRLGREVPDASGMIRFSTVGGKLVGTGSDESDHTPVPSPDRRMYAGKVSVAVRTEENVGELTLYAQSDAMQKASVTVALSASTLNYETVKEKEEKIEAVLAEG